jgi:hypothetical protein
MSEVSEGYFPEKYRLLVFEAQNGICCVDGCYSPIEEFHHGLSNTVTNRKLFPMFVKSPFNMFGMCRVHHVAGDRPKIKPCIAEVYEAYLQDVKKGKLHGNEEGETET